MWIASSRSTTLWRGGEPVGERSVASDVTVVIPTVGRELLQGCLDSIAAGTVWPGEVVVVDQGRTDLIVPWISRLRSAGLPVAHVRSNESGIAAATNRGFERVATPYVTTTHDDCRVRADWLETISERVRNVGDAIVTGRVEPEGDGVVLTIVTSMEPKTYTKPMIDRDVLFPPNMAFPVRLLSRIGYLDEHPSLRMAGEDNDWAYRAQRLGIPIVYDPDSVVSHLAWQPRGALKDVYRRYASGQGAFYGKYVRRGDPFIVRRAIRDLFRAPWLVVRGAVSRNGELLAMGYGAVLGLPIGLVLGFRNAGDQEIRMFHGG
jgi:GT2 family glycosyltransferase